LPYWRPLFDRVAEIELRTGGIRMLTDPSRFRTPSSIRAAHGTRRGLGLALSLATVVAFQVGTPAEAQSLDEQIEALLDNNCAVLAGDSGTQDPAFFGPNLQAICAIPQTSNAASSGGGAAGVQGSATSVQNAVLQQRLERARGDERDGTDDVARMLRGRRVEANLQEAEVTGGSGSRFDVFVSGTYQSLDRDVTEFEDGYDSSVVLATVGADYRFTDRIVGGVLATYQSQDGDFDGQGDFEATVFEPALYVSYLPTDATFLQVVAGWGDHDFDTRRGVEFTIDRQGGGGVTELSGIADSSTGGSATTLGALFGWDRSVRHFTFGPRVGANYRETDVDGFVESGDTGLELRVGDRTVDSFQGVIGFYGTAAYSRKSGVLLPYVSVDYVHEFEDEPTILEAQLVEDLRGAGATSFNYQTNAPSSDFFNLGIGLTAGFPRGIWPYVSLRAMIGNDHFDSFAATAGVRFEL